MSRSLVSFALAAVVAFAAAIFLWRERMKPDEPMGTGLSVQDAPADAQTRANGARPLASPSNDPVASGATVRSPAVVAADDLLDDAVKNLPGMREADRAAFVKDLIRDLKLAGPAGLRALAGFLSSGWDIPLREGYGVSMSAITAPSTVRVALLDALADWEGSASVLLEFLRGPATAWEAVLAIRALERQFPGTYRAEAISGLKAALERPAEPDFGSGGEAHVFATIARLDARELLPQAEKLAVATSNVPRYVELLSTMPVETREPALRRVLSHPEVAAEIEAAPQTLDRWSFLEPQTRGFLGGVFRDRLAPEQRVAALDALEATPPALAVEQSLFAPKQEARAADRAAAAATAREAEARQVFLAELASDKAQPGEVQAAAKAAQARITEDLAQRQAAEREEGKPLVEVPFAQGAGKAQIKGRRIEQIELQPPAVAQPALPADSTDSAPR